MKTFTDNAGRVWTLSLTLEAAKRVKSLLGVNLLELDRGDPPLLTRLGTDVILLCDVIFALVKPQADQQKVTDEQFGAALGGEAVLAAQTAFYEELVDFFRKAGRGDLAKITAAQKRMIDLTVQKMETGADITEAKLRDRMEAVDLEAEVNKVIAEELGEPSTSLPASSGSIPAP
jgi:hypothetical protein